MAPKKKQSREEILLNKKIRERERYHQIKNDPVKYERQREKERMKYENKKKKKQVKLIKDMTDREVRLQRKIWREKSRKAYMKKKLISKNLEKLPVTPPCSEDESRPLVSCPHQIVSGKKRIQRDRSRTVQKNKKLMLENKKLKTTLEKYKKRYYRLTNKETVGLNNATPRKKVKLLMKKNDGKSIRKHLLFGAALESQLKVNFQKLKNPRVKKQFINNVIGEGKVLKKCKITRELTHVFTKRLTRCNTNNYIKKRRLKLLTAQMKDDVKRFLEDEENTRLAPGKKDFKTQKKIKKQKRYLNDTMFNLHKKFLSTVSYSLSYSLFCRYRPFYVLYQKLSERDTCQCKLHTNTNFIVSTLYKHNIINAKTGKEIAEELCCNGTYNIDCLLRRCQKCAQKQISFKEFNGDDLLQYFQWAMNKDHYIDKNGQFREVKRTVKVMKTTTAIDMVNCFEDVVLKFMKHEAIIFNQYSQLKFLRATMNENEALIHVDFSENYCTKFGSEIQSFHFGGSRQQISLHTSALRFKETSYAPLKTKTFCTMSQDLNHSPIEIMAHLAPVLEYLKSVKPQLTVLHFLSDSPSTQYRNKDMFYVFSHLVKPFFPHLLLSTWNYFEAGHGKGIPDGVGGTVKRTADRLIKEGKDIDCLETLSTCLKENLRKTETYIITSDNILNVKNKIKINNIQPFKGTMQVHQVVQVHNPQKTVCITMKSMSCFKCIDINRERLLFFDCTHNTLCTMHYPIEEGNNIAIIEPSVHLENEEDQKHVKAATGGHYEVGTENSVDVVAGPSTLMDENDEKSRNVYWKDLLTGKFVLVQFTSESGKFNYRYVCSILKKDEEDGEVTVQGLKLVNNKGTEFTNVDENDVSNVPFEDVLEILDDPKIMLKNRKIMYKFAKTVNVFEK